MTSISHRAPGKRLGRVSWLSPAPAHPRRDQKPAMAEAFDLLLLFGAAEVPLSASFHLAGESLSLREPRLGESLVRAGRELSEDPDRHAVLMRFASQLDGREKEAFVKFANGLRYGTAPLRALRVASDEIFQMQVEDVERQIFLAPFVAALPLVLFFIPCILFLALHL